MLSHYHLHALVSRLTDLPWRFQESTAWRCRTVVREGGIGRQTTSVYGDDTAAIAPPLPSLPVQCERPWRQSSTCAKHGCLHKHPVHFRWQERKEAVSAGQRGRPIVFLPLVYNVIAFMVGNVFVLKMPFSTARENLWLFTCMFFHCHVHWYFKCLFYFCFSLGCLRIQCTVI